MAITICSSPNHSPTLPTVSSLKPLHSSQFQTLSPYSSSINFGLGLVSDDAMIIAAANEAATLANAALEAARDAVLSATATGEILFYGEEGEKKLEIYGGDMVGVRRKRRRKRRKWSEYSETKEKNGNGEDQQVLFMPAKSGFLTRREEAELSLCFKAHAASAVLNISENCTPDILTPYLDGIVSKFLVLLQNGKQMVQEGALTALASVADSSQVHFQKYYDAVMPYLMAILVNATDKSIRVLRAKAMECISLVGMVVGKDKFRDDAKQVMEVLMSLQGSQMKADDPSTSYMLQVGEILGTLIKTFKAFFLPFFDELSWRMIIPFLL